MNHLAQTTAILLLSGGGYAYIKAGSLPSLAGAIVASSIFLSANYMITQPNYTFNGCLLGTIGGGTLLGVSYMRWGKGKASYVPIALACLGLINCFFYGMKTWEWKPSRYHLSTYNPGNE